MKSLRAMPRASCLYDNNILCFIVLFDIGTSEWGWVRDKEYWISPPRPEKERQWRHQSLSEKQRGFLFCFVFVKTDADTSAQRETWRHTDELYRNSQYSRWCSLCTSDRDISIKQRLHHNLLKTPCTCKYWNLICTWKQQRFLHDVSSSSGRKGEDHKPTSVFKHNSSLWNVCGLHQ